VRIRQPVQSLLRLHKTQFLTSNREVISKEVTSKEAILSNREDHNKVVTLSNKEDHSKVVINKADIRNKLPRLKLKMNWLYHAMSNAKAEPGMEDALLSTFVLEIHVVGVLY